MSSASHRCPRLGILLGALLVALTSLPAAAQDTPPPDTTVSMGLPATWRPEVGGGFYFDRKDGEEFYGAELRASLYRPLINPIKMWVEAGAKSMEHGFFIDEDTAQLMAQNGVWWSMQPMEAEGEDAFVFESPISTAKYKDLVSKLDGAVAATKKYKVKTAFGTDMLFDAKLAAKQGKFLAKLKKWYTPYEALKMATSGNAELLKMSGPRDPYPGELGVIKEGAYADLLLVDGNPLQNLDLVPDPDKNFVVIMKDGKVYKNTIR